MLTSSRDINLDRLNAFDAIQRRSSPCPVSRRAAIAERAIELKTDYATVSELLTSSAALRWDREPVRTGGFPPCQRTGHRAISALLGGDHAEFGRLVASQLAADIIERAETLVDDETAE